MQSRVWPLAFLFALAACNSFDFEDHARQQIDAAPGARILVIGDSVMWWGLDDAASVSHGISAETGEAVVNLAIPGARISHPDPEATRQGLDIRSQYRPGAWDWVVVEGGANDLGDEGGQRGCQTVLDELVSADGRDGEIPGLVASIRASGAHVVAMGYYELPEFGEPDGYCGDVFPVLSERIAAMAARDPGIVFVSMADVVDPGDRAAYDSDAVHPSAASSLAIGRLVGAAIAEAEAL